MSQILSVVLAGIALLALPVSRRLTGELFTPASLIVASWCGALSLFLLRLLPYPTLHPDTAAFIVGALAMMVTGAVVGQVWFDHFISARDAARVPASAPVSAASRPPADPLPHADRWVMAFSLIGLTGTLWYVIAASRALGFSMFWVEPLEIRLALGARTIPSQFLFLEYFCVIAPTLALALTLAGVRLSRRSWLLAGLAAVATWITTDRTHFFVIVLVGYFMALFSQGPRLSIKRFVLYSGVGALLLVANFLLVGAWLGKTPQNLGLTMGLPSDTGKQAAASAPETEAESGTRAADTASVSLAGTAPYDDARAVRLASSGSWITQKARRALQRGSTLYLYSTGSFAALDTLLHAERPRTHGLHTFYPFARALERAGVIDGPVPNAIAPFLPLNLTEGPEQPYNVYTFLFYPLEDFGPAGALVYALVIGLVSGVTYAFARRGRLSPDRLLLIGHLQGALMLSIFVNKFNNTASWYVLLWSLVPFLVARARRGRAR